MKIESREETLFRVFRDRRIARDLGYPIDESTEETDLEHALANFSFCWSDNVKRGISRYSNGSWPVLYTAETVETALAEVTYHLHKDFGVAYEDGEAMTFNLVHYAVSFKGKCACYVDIPIHEQVRLTAEDYAYTNAIAANQLPNKISALRVPSARRTGEVCVPIFDRTASTVGSVAEKISVVINKGQKLFKTVSSSTEAEIEIEDVYTALQ